MQEGGSGLDIWWALGPMTRKIVCGLSKLTLGGPADFEVTVIKFYLISGKKKTWALKCEGPQKYDIKGPNDPWQFLLILFQPMRWVHNVFLKS